MSTFVLYCGPDANTQLNTLIEALPQSAVVKQRFSCAQYPQFAVAVGSVDSFICEHLGVVLAFEGYVTHSQSRGEILGNELITQFIERGEQCTKYWRGSFRVAIHINGVTRVYCDQLCTRVLFYSNANHQAIYCSHTKPILSLLPKRTINGASLLQFMHAGRFFAGQTLFNELGQISSGTAHRISPNNQFETFKWFEYLIQPELKADNERLIEFKSTLDDVIIEHYERAEQCALLLSGGVDSRYILNTLGEHVPSNKLAGLFTCLWGEVNDDYGSDASWAKREAQRHGVKFEFYQNIADVRLFESMFDAQSGMTAHVFSHSDDFHWCRHINGLGYRSLMRGDEIFGPNGTEMTSREAAFNKVGLSLTAPMINGLGADVEQWQNDYAKQVARLGGLADEPNDLRDILYCVERLVANNAHLNSQRSPFVENYNPLLDLKIVEFNQALPRHLRTNKQLFRQCFAHYYPTRGFATSGNGFDWQRLWQQNELKQLLQSSLATLPDVFDLAYWHQVGQLLDQPFSKAEQLTQLQQAVRAVVLARWLEV